MDEEYLLDDPCPECGGDVKWWYYGIDCRGNGASSGIECTKCHKTFDNWPWPPKVWPPARYNKKKKE